MYFLILPGYHCLVNKDVYISEYCKGFTVFHSWGVVMSLHIKYKKLSYHRKTALQGGLVLAHSGRMGLGDDILPTL